ncbi:hypothetical protein [Burkholderia vietnamiensis]|uniref:hypothetical protein n=1 Tax=Burkholderia vietnamiensis TaxID=60552 RepID=UPI000841EB1A|nr:hypothetical protein [Burkholderia vietnamiensis]AOK00198.1 hypothetical protein WK23_17035 [Burkholderia vietnamiensis]HEF4837298.1 hypothetical protein [Burkholderia vietnamiensis]
MTIQNDFLPFATGPGANVVDQTTYAALSALATGFLSGTALSNQLNKVWRQSSIMSAVVAQFIVAQTGQAAVDDGTTPTLLANFTKAVNAASKQRIILTDTGSVNAVAAANAVPMTALPTVGGVVQMIAVKVTNTGASTYAPDGLAARPIFGLGGNQLQGGEMPANGIATLVSYVGPLLNGGALCWVLFECIGGAQQISAASASQHAVQLGQVRLRLTANTSFYVNASTGSDSNNGLTTGTAWATLQKAWNTIQQSYDVAGFVATVNVSAGSYAPLAAVGSIVGSISASSVQFVAAGAATVTNTSGVACFYATGGAQYTYSGPWTLINNNPGASTAQASGAGSILIQGAGVTHGASNGSHLLANVYGQVQATGNYTVSGASGSHYNSANAGAIGVGSGITVTLSGTPAFSTAFAQANGLSQINAGGVTFSGSATGVRYISQSNSIVNSSSGGTNYFPGSTAGATNTGGIYI